MGMIEDILAKFTDPGGNRFAPWGPLTPIRGITDSMGLSTPESTGGAGEAVAEVLSPPGGEAFGGLGTDGGAAPPGVDPELIKEGKKKFLLKYGIDEDTASMIVDTWGEDEQETLYEKLITKGPPKSKDETYDREALAKEFPEAASIIRSAPPGALSNIISSLASKRGVTDKPGAYRVDRDAAVKANPALAPYIDAMSDSDVSNAMNDAFEGSMNAGPDGMQYRDKEGAPKLKIMQDAAFMRSGLKSGDTVCIRIP